MWLQSNNNNNDHLQYIPEVAFEPFLVRNGALSRR
jgi:hypothetical protein